MFGFVNKYILRREYEKGLTDGKRSNQEETNKAIIDKNMMVAEVKLDFKKQLADKDIEYLTKINELNNKIASLEFNKKLDVAIDSKEIVDNLVSENITLKERVAKAEATSDVLQKAFSEMGLDVKDTKSMIDKLIEGLVAKTNIQLVPTSTTTITNNKE